MLSPKHLQSQKKCSSHTELCSLHNNSSAYKWNQGAIIIFSCKFQQRIEQDSFHLLSNHASPKHTAHFCDYTCMQHAAYKQAASHPRNTINGSSA